jgi:DNA (cytosine-5)-methyltransferase 1
MVDELISSTEDPIRLLEEDLRDRVDEIVEGAGFSEKRPEMIRQLIRRFQEKFPDGDTSAMSSWNDEEVVDFLTSIPGIGQKSALCVLMYSLARDRLPIDAHVRRVLRRTGLLRELYVENRMKEHRRFQAEAEQFVPPSSRKALHTGLLAVGKEFCHPSRPQCDECPVRNICESNRSNSIILAEGRSLTHVDLFCGAGGFSAGFAKEGYRTLLAVDSSSTVCETFRLNHPDVPDGNVINQDLHETPPELVISRATHWKRQISRGRVDVLTAGIPCQGFSKAGYRSRPKMKYDPGRDPRNQLYESVIEWTEYLTPRYVIIENVPDIRSAAGSDGTILEAVGRAFRNIGYEASYDTVNAFDFGVPQIRRRFILIASHPSMPVVTPEDLYQFDMQGGTLMSSIGDLPPTEPGRGQWYCKVNGRVVTGHVARYHNEDDLEILEALEPGESYVNFVSRRRDIIERRRRRGKHAVYSTRSFSDKFHKLQPDKPSRTIVAHLQRDGNGYIHPAQTRSITPREAMRLQGFDDDFVVCGSRGSQFIQIGNAIPPPLARAIARTLRQHLKGERS